MNLGVQSSTQPAFADWSTREDKDEQWESSRELYYKTLSTLFTETKENVLNEEVHFVIRKIQCF